MLARLVGEADLAQQLGGPRVGRLARHLQDGGRADADVAQHGQVREQLEILEHHAHALAHKARGAGAALFDSAFEDDAAAIDGLERVGAAQQRRLAGAGRADQADDLAAIDLEADAERHQGAVTLDDASTGRSAVSSRSRPARIGMALAHSTTL